MYSRRFYGGDRTQRSRPAPTPQTVFERVEPIAKKIVEPNVSEPLPIMALNIPVTEDREPGLIEYPNPKDFLPEAFESRSYSEVEEVSEVSVYPDKTPPTPEVPDAENDGSADTEIKGESTDTLGSISDSTESADKTGDVAHSVRNMTFEDMVLTGLLMLGSSGEYDDDIMLILGLILMIGV